MEWYKLGLVRLVMMEQTRFRRSSEEVAVDYCAYFRG